MKVLIIEDEVTTARDLAATIRKVDDSIQIVDTLDSIEGSIRFLSQQTMPDLLFCDIQLADGLSFNIFKEVHVSCPVIFCTAYDEYAIDAFKANGIDYILKPFDDKAIRISLEKFRQFKRHFGGNNIALERLTELLQIANPQPKTSFLVSYRGKYIPVAVEDIAYFYIRNEVTLLYTYAGSNYIIPQTLDQLEQMLDSRQFYRANRQFLINRKTIKEVEPYFLRKLLVKISLETPEPVIVSKAKASAFLQWMER